jgi:ABC-type uncharacterized transport system substrate-binding protein
VDRGEYRQACRSWCVEIIRDLLPSAHRIGALGNAADSFSKLFLEQVQLAGKNTGIEITPAIMVGKPDEVDDALAAKNKQGADAIVVQGSLATKNTAELILKHHLPAISVPRAFPDSGGLMSYGLDGPDSFRRGATFVIKILQGTKPAEIASRTTHEIRIGDQSKNREGARPDDPGIIPAARRRGDRMSNCVVGLRRIWAARRRCRAA